MIYFLKAFTLLSAIWYGLYFWTSFWQLKIILSSCKRAVQFYAGCVSSCFYWKLLYGLYFVSDFAGFLLAKVSDFMCAFLWASVRFCHNSEKFDWFYPWYVVVSFFSLSGFLVSHLIVAAFFVFAFVLHAFYVVGLMLLQVSCEYLPSRSGLYFIFL